MAKKRSKSINVPPAKKLDSSSGNVIWNAKYARAAATSEAITQTEARLGVVIPKSLKDQFLVANGGFLAECDPFPFDDEQVNWTNAIVDGIDSLDDWSQASDDPWFDSVEDVDDLDLLIRIASHSEAQLCLDYRRSGARKMAGVTFIDVCMTPTEIRVLTDTADEFVRGLISAIVGKRSTD